MSGNINTTFLLYSIACSKLKCNTDKNALVIPQLKQFLPVINLNKQIFSSIGFPFIGIQYNIINKTILILENYPELKANEQFSALQKNLTKMENQIQAARRIYNNDVEKYNRTISIFPNNIVAKILQFKKEAFFEMEEQ